MHRPTLKFLHTILHECSFSLAVKTGSRDLNLALSLHTNRRENSGCVSSETSDAALLLEGLWCKSLLLLRHWHAPLLERCRVDGTSPENTIVGLPPR